MPPEPGHGLARRGGTQLRILDEVARDRDLGISCCHLPIPSLRSWLTTPGYGDGERRSDSPEGHVGYYDDRETAVRYLEELRTAIAQSGRRASPDAVLTAHAAVANTQALILFGDTLRQAMETLRDDIAPQFGRGFGGI